MIIAGIVLFIGFYKAGTSFQFKDRVYLVPDYVGFILIGLVLIDYSVLIYLYIATSNALILAILIGPFGSILRKELTRFNVTSLDFPLGTFLANILATLLFNLISIGKFTSYDLVSCTWYYAVLKGFCGCTSTISTFVHELCSIRRPFRYFFVSVIPSCLLTLIISGSILWSGKSDLCPTRTYLSYALGG
jgi:fluoride ion exporter CrcB/FEX